MQRSSIPARTGLAVVLSLLATTTLAASPPCSLTPLWQHQDPASNTYVGPGVSDAAGNLYLLRMSREPPFVGPLNFEIVSLDQNGTLRFRRFVAALPDFDVSELAVVGANVVVSWADAAVSAGVLAVRTTDGSTAWMRDLRSDLRRVAAGTIGSVSIGSPGRGDGYVAVPFSYEQIGSGQREGLAAYDPATGNIVGILQNGPSTSTASPETFATLAIDESGNLFVGAPHWAISSTLGRLTSWDRYGNFRFGAPNRSDLQAAGSGILVAGTGEIGLTGPMTQPFQIMRASNGELIGSNPRPFNSPRISGNRLTFVECTETVYDCHRAALTTYDTPSSTQQWRTPLAAIDEVVMVYNPILTTAGSIVLLQESFPGGIPSAAIREFDSAGNEYVTCTLPSGHYSGFTLAGDRFIVWGDDGEGGGKVMGFSAYGHAPAAKGWVMRGGSPQGDRRPR